MFSGKGKYKTLSLVLHLCLQPPGFQNYLGFSHPTGLLLVSARDQQQGNASVIWSHTLERKERKGNEAKARVLLSMRVEDELFCDTAKDVGSVFLFRISVMTS